MDGPQFGDEKETPAIDGVRALDPESVVRLLDEIPGAYEQAQLGLRQAEAGETVPLDEI